MAIKLIARTVYSILAVLFILLVSGLIWQHFTEARLHQEYANCDLLEDHQPLPDAEVMADDVPLYDHNGDDGEAPVGHLKKGDKVQIAGICRFGKLYRILLSKEQKHAMHTVNVVIARLYEGSFSGPNFTLTGTAGPSRLDKAARAR